MIFAKQPLDIHFRSKKSRLRFGYVGIHPKGSCFCHCLWPILCFHHQSSKDFLLSPSFQQQLPDLSCIQDRDLHERQFAVFCSNIMVPSNFLFNMCNLSSSRVYNMNILVLTSLPSLPSFHIRLGSGHIIFSEHKAVLMKVVKLIIHNKLLFWIESPPAPLSVKSFAPRFPSTLTSCDGSAFSMARDHLCCRALRGVLSCRQMKRILRPYPKK